MQSYKITLSPQSAFATPLKGDTLFGQLCWAIRNRFGETRLNELLTGYTDGQPFAVVSDAFPSGYLPLPTLPGAFYLKTNHSDRKALKKKVWLPLYALDQPVADWQNQAVDNKTIAASHAPRGSDAFMPVRVDIATKHRASLSEKRPQPHNSINRQTNTTGEGFAPYSIEQEWFIPGLRWDVYVLLDNRLSEQDCKQCLEDIDAIGYGKDASIGLGKFSVDAFAEHTLPKQTAANACLTLAPCTPQGLLGFDGDNSYYQLFTRFGRHGDIAVHQTGQPFKNPVLLAQTAAVFATQPPATGFIGQGLGGNRQLSITLPETVQQGYAPVLGIRV